MLLSFALPGNGRYRTTQERQRPRWLRLACLRAEEDLSVPESVVQSEGLSLTTKSTNFHEWGPASPGNFVFGFIRVHS